MILYKEYFSFWYFKYILYLTLYYFYSSKVLNAGYLLVAGVFLHGGISTFTWE